jgi:toxin ParE1/3/4
MRAFQLLGDNPHAGRQRDELRASYRSFPVGEYVLFYQIARPGVRVMQIVQERRVLGTYGF